MRTVTVANLKGGTSKSTTAAYLAHALTDDPSRTLVVDADPPASLVSWSEQGQWAVPVIGLPVRDLHSRLPGIAGDRYDWTVIDTPPLDERAGIVYSALRCADVVVVPVAASTIELDRLWPVLDAVEQVAPLVQTPPQVLVVLTRVLSRATSTQTARDAIGDIGLRVAEAVVPRLERYSLAFGAPVTLAADDPYAEIANEIRQMGAGQ